MKSRDVGIVASATLVGVMLGAVSVLSGQDSSQSADVVSYFGGQPAEENSYEFRRRTVRRRVDQRPPVPRYVLPSDGTFLREAAPTRQLGVSLDCIIRVGIISELHRAVMRVVPATNLFTYNQVNQVFQDSISDCIAEMMEAEMMQEEMAEKVHEAAPDVLDCLDPSYCSMFSRKRRTQCEGAQRVGICYWPGQMYRGQ